MGERSRNLDLLPVALVVLTMGLSVFGLVMIYSATRSFDLAARQGVWLFVSIVATYILVRLNYVEFMRLNRHIYLCVLALLIVVLAPPIGKIVNGARSWIPLGPLGNLQPSEIAKVGIIITLATLLRNARVFERHEVFPAIVHVGVPVALILLQPDFGTAMVFVVVLFAMLFVAGTDLRWLAGMAVAGMTSVPLMVRYVLRDYQRQRLLVFLDPYSDPLRSGWNVIQSLVSVGSGRLFGKGLFGSTQGRLGFLPARHNDFIFALVCEELGFVGALLVISTYGAILLIGLKVAVSAKDDYGRYIASGVVALYLAHIMINIGMVIGLMPVTGIPLPFISYGGSSLLTNWIGLGLLISVYSRRTKLSFK